MSHGVSGNVSSSGIGEPNPFIQIEGRRCRELYRARSAEGLRVGERLAVQQADEKLVHIVRPVEPQGFILVLAAGRRPGE